MILYLLIMLITSSSQNVCHVFKDQDFWLTQSREKKVCEWMPEVFRSSKENNIEPTLVMALITVESGWDRKAVSYMNACGLTQVIPKYTGKITKKYTCEQLKDPVTSIKAGTKILRWWIDYHTKLNNKSKPEVALSSTEVLKRGLCSYNAGFRCSGPKPLKAGMRYSKKVLSQKQKIERIYNDMKSLELD